MTARRRQGDAAFTRLSAFIAEPPPPPNRPFCTSTCLSKTRSSSADLPRSIHSIALHRGGVGGGTPSSGKGVLYSSVASTSVAATSTLWQPAPAHCRGSRPPRWYRPAITPPPQKRRRRGGRRKCPRRLRDAVVTWACAAQHKTPVPLTGDMPSTRICPPRPRPARGPTSTWPQADGWQMETASGYIRDHSQKSRQCASGWWDGEDARSPPSIMG